jgi:hypothetical protein
MKYLFLLPLCLMGCTSTISITDGCIPTTAEDSTPVLTPILQTAPELPTVSVEVPDAKTV